MLCTHKHTSSVQNTAKNVPFKFWNIHKHFIGFNRVTPDNERIQRIRWGQMQRMTNKLNIFQRGGVIRYDVTEPLLKIQCIFSVTEYPIAIQHTPFQNVHYKSVTFFFDHRKHFLIPYKQCNTIYSRSSSPIVSFFPRIVVTSLSTSFL